MNTNHLIIGAGFLGSVLAKKIENQVWITRRQPSLITKDAQICLDVNQPETWKNLQQLKSLESISLYCLIPPSKIDLAVFSEFLSTLDDYPIQKAILVSSTVVYGQEARIVDADSEVLIDSPRAEKQFAIEQAWQKQFAAKSCVLRLAGLYGLGRVIGQRGINEGDEIGGNPEGFLNLIHAEDAANLIQTVSKQENSSSVELGCDDTPVLRRDYYTKLAELLNAKPPSFSSNVTRGGNRICSNEITKRRTGWQPNYPDSLKAIVELI